MILKGYLSTHHIKGKKIFRDYAQLDADGWMPKHGILAIYNIAPSFANASQGVPRGPDIRSISFTMSADDIYHFSGGKRIDLFEF